MNSGVKCHPPADGDVMNRDATFGEEFLDIAMGESVAEMPAHSQQDHLRREPKPRERSGLSDVAPIQPTASSGRRPSADRAPN